MALTFLRPAAMKVMKASARLDACRRECYCYAIPVPREDGGV